MRTTPFTSKNNTEQKNSENLHGFGSEQSAGGEDTPAPNSVTNGGLENIFGSLNERLAVKPKLNNPAPPEAEKGEEVEEKNEEETTTGTKENKGTEYEEVEIIDETTSDFDAEYEDFKKKTGETFEQWLGGDLDSVGELLAGFLNGVRVFFMPKAYGWVAGFDAEEKAEIKALLQREKEADKNKEKAEFSDREKRLLGYFHQLTEAQNSISYSKEEIQKLGKKIGEKLKDMPVPELLKKFDLVIFMLFLEWKRADKLVYGRVQRGVEKKFGL